MNKNYDTLLLDADDTLLDFRKTEKAPLQNTLDSTDTNRSIFDSTGILRLRGKTSGNSHG